MQMELAFPGPDVAWIICIVAFFVWSHVMMRRGGFRDGYFSGEKYAVENTLKKYERKGVIGPPTEQNKWTVKYGTIYADQKPAAYVSIGITGQDRVNIGEKIPLEDEDFDDQFTARIRLAKERCDTLNEAQGVYA